MVIFDIDLCRLFYNTFKSLFEFYEYCYEIKWITRVSSNLLVHQLIVGKHGTSSICSPRMICEILPCFYHLFGEKSTNNLQLLDFILLSI